MSGFAGNSCASTLSPVGSLPPPSTTTNLEPADKCSSAPLRHAGPTGQLSFKIPRYFTNFQVPYQPVLRERVAYLEGTRQPNAGDSMQVDEDPNGGHWSEAERKFQTEMERFFIRILFRAFSAGVWPEKEGYTLNIDGQILVYDEITQRYIEKMVKPVVRLSFLLLFFRN